MDQSTESLYTDSACTAVQKEGDDLTVAPASEIDELRRMIKELRTQNTSYKKLNDQLQTEIIKREQAGETVENENERLIDNLIDTFLYRHDTEGVLGYVSSSVTRVLGYSTKEMQSHFTEYMTDTPINLEVIKHTEKSISGLRQPPYQVQMFHKDGTTRWLEVSETPVLDENGKVVAVEGIAHDITQRKQTEGRLQKSEAFLDAVGKMAKVGGWEMDLETLDIRWTKETRRIHEVPLDYIPSLNEALNFYDPQDRPKIEVAVQRAIQHGEPYDMELRFITAKGRNIWTQAIGRPQVVDGKTVKLSGTFQDITERKRFEEKLRLSEEKFSKAFYASPDSITITSVDDGILVDVNEGFEHLLECPRQEALGKTTLELGFWENPEDRNLLVKVFREDGRVRDLEISVRTRAGDVRKCLMSCEKIDIDNKAYLLSIAKDITEHKKKQEQAYQRKLELAVFLERLELLTDRERQVMYMVADGKMSKEIAFKLDLSRRTVETHRTKIMSKLQMDSVAQLVRHLTKHEFLESSS